MWIMHYVSRISIVACAEQMPELMRRSVIEVILAQRIVAYNPRVLTTRHTADRAVLGC